MATNPLGKNSKNIVVNVPDFLYEAIQILAARNGMKMGAYVRNVLSEAKEKQLQFKTVSTTTAIASIMAGQTPAAPANSDLEAAKKKVVEVVKYHAGKSHKSVK